MSTETAEYCSWRAMKYRCQNPKAKGYHNYGGRGIVICKEWDESFTAFFADMGRKPSRQYTIERRDTNGNYEPNNCYWATRQEQNDNKRTNRLLTVDGVTLTRSEWARRSGVKLGTIRWRLDEMGLPPDVAVDPGFDAGPHVFGEDHPIARATVDKVVEIRQRVASGDTISKLSRDLGLDRSTIRKIVQRKTWKHVL